MNVSSILREAAQALRFNRQRTLLTMISLGWGVACFVILWSYGDGFHLALRTAFLTIGQDLILMFGGQTSAQAGGERAGRRIRLERTDIAVVRESSLMAAAISPEMMMGGMTVVRGYRTDTTMVRAVSTSYGRIRNMTMAAGRWIGPEDDVQKERVAVLGAKAASLLFGEIPPEGEEITINGLRFTVVGVLKTKAQVANYGTPDNESIFIPFETGSLLAAPLREPDAKAPPETLNGILVHALTHAWISAPNLPPPPAWLNEGVATFMGSMWVEKQHGREAALGTLEANRAALALAEPESPGQSAGQPLAQAISPVYYRTKAAYVLWMLRDLAGDQALAAALRAYDPVQDAKWNASPPANSDNGKAKKPGYFESLLTDNGYKGDLSWFFADWVYADKGLPDLSINGIFPTATSAGNWLVAVHIANAGYAAAEVPVTVRSGSGADATSVTQRVRIPARGESVPRLVIQGKPTSVQINDGAVPETQASVHITRLDEAAHAPPGSSQSNPPAR